MKDVRMSLRSYNFVIFVSYVRYGTLANELRGTSGMHTPCCLLLRIISFAPRSLVSHMDLHLHVLKTENRTWHMRVSHASSKMSCTLRCQSCRRKSISWGLILSSAYTRCKKTPFMGFQIMSWSFIIESSFLTGLMWPNRTCRQRFQSPVIRQNDED